MLFRTEKLYVMLRVCPDVINAYEYKKQHGSAKYNFLYKKTLISSIQSERKIKMALVCYLKWILMFLHVKKCCCN